MKLLWSRAQTGPFLTTLCRTVAPAPLLWAPPPWQVPLLHSRETLKWALPLLLLPWRGGVWCSSLLIFPHYLENKAERLRNPQQMTRTTVKNEQSSGPHRVPAASPWAATARPHSDVPPEQLWGQRPHDWTGTPTAAECHQWSTRLLPFERGGSPHCYFPRGGLVGE